MDKVKSFLKRIAELEGRRSRRSLSHLSDDELEPAMSALAADIRGQPLTAEMKAAILALSPPQPVVGLGLASTQAAAPMTRAMSAAKSPSIRVSPERW
jgi:hypothetical protein